MSYVTEVIVFGSGEETAIRRIEGECAVADKTTCHPIRFVEVSRYSGGCKGFGTGVYLASVNYLDRDAFWASVGRQSWEYPEMVEVLVKHEEDETFFRWRPGEKLPGRD